MLERRHTITTADGVDLAAWLSAPPDPAGVLVLCHGLTTDHVENGAFDRLQKLALRKRLAVARYDARSHGESGGENEHFRLAGVRQDVEAVLGLVDEHLGAALPRVPVGLSFGGAAAAHAAVTHPATAGMVLWYAVVDYEHNYGLESPVEFTHQMRRDAAGGPPWAGMTIAAAGYHLPQGLIDELLTDRTPHAVAGLDVPVLALHGSRDRFVDAAPMRRLADRHAHVTLRMLPGAGHGFFLWLPYAVRRTVAFALTQIRG